MRPSLAISILLFAVACFAQVPSPKPNGVVTGGIFCGDTGRPARFASVFLLNKATIGSTSEPTRGTTMVTTTVNTALDGSYTFTHVSPGTYYIIVKKDGYITPLTMFSQKQLEEPTDQTRALAEKALPRVQVEPDSTTRADVQLHRGAVVSGTITYDDGTPASGIAVNLRHHDEDGNWVYLLGSDPVEDPMIKGFTTDDRGYFRIASLLPDAYLLEAALNLGEKETVTTSDSAGRRSVTR